MSSTSPTLARRSPHLTHPKYRQDIDGLRAIAVLSVVCFHAFPTVLKGGFIGVDIFFVISGFLISSIIFDNIKKNSFSFIEFYSRRVRRIFPALLLMLLAVFGIGWFVLLGSEYKQLGKHIAGGAGFVSNILLWRESGYFDNAADTKPLLHLWSLGIEEQFYIIWPLLLWFSWRMRINLLAVTTALAIISFTLNEIGIGHDDVATFYSPQTRFWELMSGSILAYTTLYKPYYSQVLRGGSRDFLRYFDVRIVPEASTKTLHNIMSVIGALLIATGVLITKEKNFPGSWALLPTVGAVLLISAGTRAWFNHVVLSNRVLVWFGLVSYPLYLWHWPLLSFARIIESGTPSIEIRISAVILSIALSWLTYELVEKPLRFGKHGRTKAIALLVCMVGFGFVGRYCYDQDGFLSRTVIKLNPSQSSANDGFDKGETTYSCGLSAAEQALFTVCGQDSRQPLKYALIGDSKAAAIYDGLIRTSTENGRWLVIAGYGPNAPVPVLSDAPIYEPYQNHTKIALKALSGNSRIKSVVIVTATRILFQLKSDSSIDDLPDSSDFHYALDGLTNTVKLLINAGKKVVIVEDNPTLPHPEDCVGRTTSLPFINRIIVNKVAPDCHFPLTRYLSLTTQYRNLLRQVASIDPDKVKIFGTTKYMCDVEKGVCQPSRNGRLLYSYTDHISDYAAGLIGVDLNKFLQSF